MKKDKIIWINQGWQPVLIGFCPSRKAWKKFVKKTCEQKHPYPEDVAAMSYFDNEYGGRCCIVNLNLPQNAKSLDAYSYIVHEVVHVWQKIKDHIGEDKPSPEFEAYSIQYIALDMWKAYDKYQKKFNPNLRPLAEGSQNGD